MKRIFGWQFTLAIILIALSLTFYLIHYVIFRDARHIIFYLIGDIAFLFVDVLIVALILHRLLEYREKQTMLKKMNMAIGTFYSEIGNDLLKQCIGFDGNIAAIRNTLADIGNWNENDFEKAKNAIAKHQSNIENLKGGLEDIKKVLLEKRVFLLNLLQNQNLLEHESFTDLLWAIFHLTDELSHRTLAAKLSEADCKHISGDIKRVYFQLVSQWIDYLKHLKQDYPYLHSLAVRTNPFNEHIRVEL